MNLRTLIALTALAGLAAGPSAHAEMTTFAGSSVGTFDAAGSGSVVMRGNFVAFGKIRGSVTVRDTGGRAVVRLGGVVQRPRIVRTGATRVRLYTLTNVNKAFYVKGRSVRVTLTTRAPNALSVSLFGRGQVLRLAGTGTYNLGTTVQGTWSEARLPLQVKPEPPARPAEPDRS